VKSIWWMGRNGIIRATLANVTLSLMWHIIYYYWKINGSVLLRWCGQLHLITKYDGLETQDFYDDHKYSFFHKILYYYVKVHCTWLYHVEGLSSLVFVILLKFQWQNYSTLNKSCIVSLNISQFAKCTFIRQWFSNDTKSIKRWVGEG
jgi:hypothetical protein